MTTVYEAPLVEALQPKPYDKYTHVAFMEDEAPDLAIEAQRIHAEGYYAMGFVNKDAIQADGTLTTEIDKARGPNVKYYLDFNPEEGAFDRAAVRKFNLVEGQTYRDTPAYAICKDYLSPLGESLLDVVEDQEGRIKEIGALARSANAKPDAVFELFRKIVQDANETDEVWFMTIVADTRAVLEHRFGRKNFISLGENVPIGSDDELVADRIELAPTLVRPSKFIDNILVSMRDPELRVSQRRALERSLVFMTDGLRPEEMSDDVARARQELLLSQFVAKNQVES